MSCHEVLRRGHPQRIPHLVVGRVGPAVPQVVGDGAGEQVSPLRDKAQCGPQILGVVVAHIDVVDPDSARADIIKPADQRHQRRLARTGAAHDGGSRARRNSERNALQHRLLRAGIAEFDLIEYDCAAHRTSRPARGGRTADRGSGVQHLGDPLGAYRGARQDRQDQGGHQYGHQDLHEVGQERDQRTDLHPAGVDEPSAEPDQRDAGDVDGQRGHRQHQGLPATGNQGGIGDGMVGGVEALLFEGLATEGPDDSHAG